MLYLSVEQIRSLHQNIILQSGGSLGIRDLNLLESACLEINNYHTNFPQKISEDFMISVAEKEQDLKNIARFFKKHSRKS